jgi:hypothetical protein
MRRTAARRRSRRPSPYARRAWRFGIPRPSGGGTSSSPRSTATPGGGCAMPSSAPRACPTGRTGRATRSSGSAAARRSSSRSARAATRSGGADAVPAPTQGGRLRLPGGAAVADVRRDPGPDPGASLDQAAPAVQARLEPRARGADRVSGCRLGRCCVYRQHPRHRSRALDAGRFGRLAARHAPREDGRLSGGGGRRPGRPRDGRRRTRPRPRDGAPALRLPDRISDRVVATRGAGGSSCPPRTAAR